jgi:hypothetical protein
MTKSRLQGMLLLACAGLMILAMVINHHIVWLAVDLFVIVVCGVHGILFIKKGERDEK